MLPGAFRPHLKALTSLRIFAALHVVGRHFADALLHRDMTHWADRAAADPTIGNQLIAGALRIAFNIVDCGSASVSLFFVLSGFILAYTYLDPQHPRKITRRDFWIARIARVYPVYLLGWFIAAPAAAKHLLDPATRLIEKPTLPILSLTATHAWVPAWGLDWNAPSWSLCTEALFYLLFPLIFAIGASSVMESRATLLRKTLLWLGVALAIPIAYCVIDPDRRGFGAILHVPQLPLDNSWPWMLAVSFHPILRLPELLAGVALGKLFLTRAHEHKRPPIAMSVVSVLLVIGVYAARPGVPVVFYTSGGMAPLFALVIYTFAFGGGLARLISGSLLVLLGEASYALYILHVPIAGFFRTAFQKVRPGWFAGTEGELARSPTWTYFVLYTVMMLVISIASFWYFETPTRSLVRGWLSKRREAVEPQPSSAKTI